MEDRSFHDVLVIGSGASGLSLALGVAPELSVAVLAKGPLKEGNTYYAQGGVAAVLDKTDSVDSHIADTIGVGAGLCDQDIVRFVIENGHDEISKLADLGVDFNRMDSGGEDSYAFHLTREGGHSHRRIVHAADATGAAIETTLEDQVRRRESIYLFEHHVAIDLITSGQGSGRCLGAYVMDLESGSVKPFRAKTVVLATGGASKVYLYTSNPDGSTGDGIAMAWRAGCRVGNMEFFQFHPTCLYHPQAKSFLITEAVRGEGGKLLLPDGSRFMDRFDERGELAPRDIVARAIDHEMKRLGADCVYLDISDKPAEFIESRFPTVLAKCREFGFEMTREAIPVVPAAHYTCGGIVVDRCGRTDIAGLYAIGEAAFTGLHGANRLASNSLLECLVFSSAAGRDILENINQAPVPPELPPWDESWVTDSDEEVVVSHNWDELRRFMWDYVGIVRTDKRLNRALRRIELLLSEIAENYGNFRITSDLLELRNLAVVAELIIRSALKRKESRGLHYTLDYPERLAEAKNTILEPGYPCAVKDIADQEIVNGVIGDALEEDLGGGDITSIAVIPEAARFRGVMTARENMTVAGLAIALQVFAKMDDQAILHALVRDGDDIEAGTRLATIEGLARPLLSAERTALNLLQHLSGIATLSRAYVNRISGSGAVLLDTRKTVPGLRALAKYASRQGGAKNHRMGLGDGVLIKDNHIAVAGSVGEAVGRARAAGLKDIEVECETLDQVKDAIKAGARRLLLDNMDNHTLVRAVRLARGRAETEASGGVNLESIGAIAETGVDYISVGRITQSAPAVDIGLDWEADDTN